MANLSGKPIWYELLGRDSAVTEPFYTAVLGWRFTDAGMEAGMYGGTGGPAAYRFIKHGEGEYDFVGGAMQLTPEMLAGGALPMWVTYFCVEDVDAAAARIAERGGSVLMAPFDIEGVGRMAFVTDPQGIPFYVMRGISDPDTPDLESPDMDSPDMESHVFAAEGSHDGRCGWNELITPDLDAALGFYRDIFGYDTAERMSMGPEMGDYVFLKTGDRTIGAAMAAMEGSSPCWRFYFRVPDIEIALSAVEANGGSVVFGPEDVPGDEVVIMAHDPEGTIFGLLAPKKD